MDPLHCTGWPMSGKRWRQEPVIPLDYHRPDRAGWDRGPPPSRSAVPADRPRDSYRGTGELDGMLIRAAGQIGGPSAPANHGRGEGGGIKH